MKSFFVLTTGMITFCCFAGCAGPSPADTPPTGFQKTMATVGHATWTATKAVGYGFGYVAEKTGQGLGLVGKGVANTGGSLEKSTGL